MATNGTPPGVTVVPPYAERQDRADIPAEGEDVPTIEPAHRRPCALQVSQSATDNDTQAFPGSAPNTGPAVVPPVLKLQEPSTFTRPSLSRSPGSDSL